MSKIHIQTANSLSKCSRSLNLWRCLVKTLFLRSDPRQTRKATRDISRTKRCFSHTFQISKTKSEKKRFLFSMNPVRQGQIGRMPENQRKRCVKNGAKSSPRLWHSQLWIFCSRSILYKIVFLQINFVLYPRIIVRALALGKKLSVRLNLHHHQVGFFATGMPNGSIFETHIFLKGISLNNPLIPINSPPPAAYRIIIN